MFVPPDLRDSASAVFSEDEEDISPGLGAIGSFGRNFWVPDVAGGEDLRICAAVLPPGVIAFIAPFVVGARVEPLSEGKSSSLGTRCWCGCDFWVDGVLDVAPKPENPLRVGLLRLLEILSALIFEGKDARAWAIDALSGWTPP